MTYTISTETSPVSIQRGRLKHSWLENEVLNKDPETVVTLRHEFGWPELERFVADAEQALKLAQEVEYGFSPARLVDGCVPLSALLEDQRNAIREGVHAAYLGCFDAIGAGQCLHEAANQMKTALLAMLDEWNKTDGVISDDRLQALWRSVLNAAEHLRNALDVLPRGIVLP